jgi:hypothetical protein
MVAEFGFSEEQEKKVFNVEETGFLLNNKLPKLINGKGKREETKLSRAEHGENISVVACFSPSRIHTSPFVIFKGVRFREIYREDL